MEKQSRDSENFVVQALNLYDIIPTKVLRPVLGEQVLHSTPSEILIQYGKDQFLFVYRFGSLVFFNVAPDDMERETARIRTALGPSLDKPTAETFHVRLAEQDKVEFDHADIRGISEGRLRMIALTVGQSAALEYFEIKADSMLRETSALMERLARRGNVPLNSRVLLKFIGSAAGTRQSIISNLAILDPPEETWQSIEIQTLFRAMQAEFDIDIRFRILDRKLSLVQDNLEILADLVSTRRTVILETLVVLLIVLELVLALVHKVAP